MSHRARRAIIKIRRSGKKLSCTHDCRSDASRSSCCASKNFSWVCVDQLFEKLLNWQEPWSINSWPSMVPDRVPSLCRRGKYARCSQSTPHLSSVKHSVKKLLCSGASIFPAPFSVLFQRLISQRYISIQEGILQANKSVLTHGNYVWRHKTRHRFHISNTRLLNYYLRTRMLGFFYSPGNY